MGLNQGSLSSKMDHLVCFLPGTLAWYATKGKQYTPDLELTARERMDLDLAEELAKSTIFIF